MRLGFKKCVKMQGFFLHSLVSIARFNFVVFFLQNLQFFLLSLLFLVSWRRQDFQGLSKERLG